MRFVVCGEALIDLLQLAPQSDDEGGDGSRPYFRTLWEAQSAGGPMNTAVALAQLGDDVQFLGRFSTDVYADQLTRHLEDCRVGLDLAVTAPGQPTSLAVVSLDAHGKATYVFHFEQTANFAWTPDDLPQLGADDWLHVASLATVVEPGASVLLAWLAGSTCSLSYDINVRPSVITDPHAYWRAVVPWLSVCATKRALVKASDDDVAFLGQGSGHTGTPVEIAQAWVRELGLTRFVITLGPDGAAAVESDGTVVTVPGHQVDVADTVGAGDTFMAGMLDALGSSAGIEDAMRQGSMASAFVVTRTGAQPPTRAELTDFARDRGEPTG